MKKTIGKKVGRIIFGLILALCAVFSFGIIVVDKEVKVEAGGGISIESGADIDINGGYIQNNYDSAITIDLGTGETRTISNTRISGSENGAIVVTGSGTLTIDNCVIENNTNENNGGAIYVGENVTLNIANTKILNNSTEGNGGAIYAAGNSRVNISGATTISENRGVLGGGVYLETDALLNDGAIAVNEYFADNTSTSDANVWQNVYYKIVDIAYQLEGIMRTIDEPTIKQFENGKSIETTSVIDLNALLSIVESDELGNIFSHDYYTWLANKDSLNILDFEELEETAINEINLYEGLGKITFYGENKIKYTLNNDHYEIEKRRQEISGALKIQSTYNDKNVATIKDEGFYNCVDLTYIDMPSGIQLETIGEYGFYNCSGISSIEVPSSVTSIGTQAFANCSGLTEIKYNANNANLENSVITAVNGIKAYPFTFYNSGKAGINIIINAEVVYDYLFYKAANVTNVTILSNVKELKSGVFEATNVKNVDARNAFSLEKIGESSFSQCKSLEKFVMPTNSVLTQIGDYALNQCHKLTNIIIPESVMSIGCYAFNYCSVLTSMEIPSGVTSIGTQAFAYCSGFTSINYNAANATLVKNTNEDYPNVFNNAGNGNTKVILGCEVVPNFLFLNNTKIKELVVGSSVQSIGQSAFNGCTQLQNVDMSGAENLANVGAFAFMDNYSLSEIKLKSSITYIGTQAFANCSGLTKIEYYASAALGTSKIEDVSTKTEYPFTFYNSGKTGENVIVDVVVDTGIVPGYLFYKAANVTDVILGSKVGRLEGAFEGCSTLKSVDASESQLHTITGYAFTGCKNLETFTMPTIDSLITIEEYSFNNCQALTSITIPSTVMTINWRAFNGCLGLSEIYYNAANATLVNASNEDYPNVFSNAGNGETKVVLGCEVVPNFLFLYNTKIKELVVGSSVQSIGQSAFNECTALNSVNMENATNLTKIGAYAFIYCYSLQEIKIGSSVDTIGKEAFRGCSGTTKITIPSSVTSIGTKAFAYCSNLALINYNVNDLNTELNKDSNIFAECASGAKIIIGGRTVSAYLLYDNSYIGQVVFNESVEILDDYALYGCTGITGNLIIPKNIKCINRSAFGNCKNINTIAFENPMGWRVSPTDDESDANWFYITNTDAGVLNNKTWLTDSSTNGYGNFFWKQIEILEYVPLIDETCGVALKDDCRDYCGGVWIPSAYENLLVTTIIDKGFYSSPIQYLEFSSNILNIGVEAFSGCTALTSITIPENVTSVGYRAFYGCSGLSEIIYNATISEFGLGTNDGATTHDYPEIFLGAGNGSASVVIGSSIIPCCLFYQNTGVSSVTLKNTVTYIGQSAFNACSNLTTVSYDESPALATIKDYAFIYCLKLGSITIPESVTSIGTQAFAYCSGLSSIKYNADVQPKEEFADLEIFKGAGNGNCSVSIGSSVITDYLFCNTTGISSVDLGAVMVIGWYAFDGCIGLTNITIPSTVEKIWNYAFAECSSLESIIYNGNISIDAYLENPDVFYMSGNGSCSVTIGSTIVPAHLFNGVTGIASLNLGSAETIGSYAFSGCSGIITASLVNIKEVGEYSFYNCTSLNQVVFANYINAIGVSTFENCTSLSEINMSNATNLTIIGKMAFANCENISTINIPTNVIEIQQGAFYNTSITYQTVTFNVGNVYLWDVFSVDNNVETAFDADIISGFYVGDGGNNKEYLISYLKEDCYTIKRGQEFINHYNPNNFVLSISGDRYVSYNENSMSIIDGEFNMGYFYKLFDRTYSYDITFCIGNFSFATNMTSLILPEGVLRIGDSSFYYCPNLLKITLPSTITHIYGGAFQFCDNLTYIESVNTKWYCRNVAVVGKGWYETTIEDMIRLVKINESLYKYTIISSMDYAYYN